MTTEAKAEQPINTNKVEIQKAVEKCLLERFAHFAIKPLTQKGGAEEAAFLAGASAVLQAVFPDSDPSKLSSYVPPLWIIWPLSGRSVVVELRKKQ